MQLCGRFQNSLDFALVGSIMLLILFSGVYTFATEVDSSDRVVLEFVMSGGVVFSIIGSLARCTSCPLFTCLLLGTDTPL